MTASPVVNTFTLDFNADGWTVEEAVRCIFLENLVAPEADDEARERRVASVLKALGRIKPIPLRMQNLLRKPQTEQELHEKNLVEFLQKVRVTRSASKELVPVLWAKLAVQYWMRYGGNHQPFMEGLRDWLQALGDADVRVGPIDRPKSIVKTDGVKAVRPKGKAIQIPIAAFLFDSCTSINLGKSKISIEVKTLKKEAPQVNLSKRVVVLKKMIGKNVYGTVKSLIDDAIEQKAIPKLSSRIDQKSGKFTYTGLHVDLCKEIFKLYPQKKGGYSHSTIERAIREIVASRRSWPKGTRKSMSQ